MNTILAIDATQRTHTHWSRSFRQFHAIYKMKKINFNNRAKHFIIFYFSFLVNFLLRLKCVNTIYFAAFFRYFFSVYGLLLFKRNFIVKEKKIRFHLYVLCDCVENRKNIHCPDFDRLKNLRNISCCLNE